MMEAKQQRHADTLHDIVAGLFDIPVGVGVTDPSLAQVDVLPTEAPHIARARPARRREFAAGRAAARAAMTHLGCAPLAVPASADRAPIWPKGISGSISHAQSLCVAVVSQNASSISLDVEEATALDPKLLDTICSPAEQARIAGPDAGLHAKLIFCAKEATYKAQYPLTRLLFSFDHLDVALNPKNHSFTATFLKPAGLFEISHVLSGRYAITHDHFVTAVTIGPR
jgi:4'-phosphopantetheinyl transferase EntD